MAWPRSPEHVVALAVAMLATWPVMAAAQGDSTARRRIAPRFAGGVVWVEPLPYTPRELAAMISGRSPSAIHDSAVVALTQRFLEAMAAQAERERANRPADWTTSIGDQKVGLDAQWIYLGPLKVPTILLGLLPIDFGGNPTELDRARRLAAMRDDLLIAGRRSANLAEFQAAVRRLREEREAQRQFERNRRTPPQEVPE
jgi:hypothetical protein